MSNKYKVGDTVKLRSDLVLGQRYGGLHYIPHLEQFQRRTFKVCRTFSCDHYFLEGCSVDGQKLYVSAAMLEPAMSPELDRAWKFDRKGLTNAK